MLDIDIDACKLSGKGSVLKFALHDASVFESNSGFHFTDYLDRFEEITPEIDSSTLTEEVRRYIEGDLQANPERFSRHVELANSFLKLENARCLDVGCGGGLFLCELKARGAEVYGIEPNDSRAHYARTTYGIELSKLPVENPYWQIGHRNSFDLITLWDVIEHVNLPFQTLQESRKLLKSGGFLMLDTPCKDSFYYRFGALSYRLTRGRWPTFLDAMYKNEPFGHKQIFSRPEMRSMLDRSGFDCRSMDKIHELSFPMAHYLRRLRIDDPLAGFLGATLGGLIKLIRVRNKMVVVAQKV